MRRATESLGYNAKGHSRVGDTKWRKPGYGISKLHTCLATRYGLEYLRICHHNGSKEIESSENDVAPTRDRCKLNRWRMKAPAPCLAIARSRINA